MCSSTAIGHWRKPSGSGTKPNRARTALALGMPSTTPISQSTCSPLKGRSQRHSSHRAPSWASMTIGTASLISSGTLVRFTPCPRFAFPIAGVAASLPVYVVTIVAAILATVLAATLSPLVLLLPFGLAWLLVLTAGLVMMTSSLTVRYRDTLSALPFILQVGLFLAPIAYPLSSLGPTVRTLVELNPLTGLVEAWRWMVISGYHASPRVIVYSLVFTAVIAILGWRTFTRLETTMADEI